MTCSSCGAIVARVWDMDTQQYVNLEPHSADEMVQDFDPTGLGHVVHVCREQAGPPVPDWDGMLSEVDSLLWGAKMQAWNGDREERAGNDVAARAHWARAEGLRKLAEQKERDAHDRTL